MISVQKDVLINYVENPNIYSEDSRNTVLVCEVLAKTLKNPAPFCVKINSLADLATYADQTNVELYEFTRKFFNFAARPDGFWLAASSADGSSGFLQTGTLENWDDFKARFVNADHPEIYKPLSFLINAGPATALNACNYVISGTDLLTVDSYDQLLAKLQLQNVNFLAIQFKDSIAFLFLTVQQGATNGVLSYMTESASTSTEGAHFIGGADIGNFADFKEGKDTVNLTFKNSDNNEIATLNIGMGPLNSWTDFAQAITAQSAGALIGRYVENKLVISRTAVGADSTFADNVTSTGDGVPAALKLTGDTGAVVVQGAADVETVDASSFLKGAQDSVGVDKEDGKDSVGKSKEYMQAFKMLAAAAMIDPALVVLSPHITLNADKTTDIDVTKTMMQGFTEYFSYAGEITIAAISIASTLWSTGAEVETNPFNELRDSPNARNYIVNYSKTTSEYLDGAVAAYCASFDWDRPDSVKDIFCKDFVGLTADNAIDDTMDGRLKEFGLNFYGKMSNGDSAYRYGTTLSIGDAANIITAVGINAFIKSLRSAIWKLRKSNSLKLNAYGATAIYAAISEVCDGFVANGFLSAISFRENGKTSLVPAYEILVDSSFTRANLANNTFPAVTIKILPTVYAKSITITISNEIWS